MTDLKALAAAARAILPAQAAVAATDPRAAAPPLWPGEAITALPKRCTEFAAGRSAARAAMAQLGLPAAAIAMAPDRAPLWPAGLTGSITHSATACLAAVQRAPGLIGLDLEPATALDRDLWSITLRAEEQEWLATQSNAPLLAKLIFSAKEAAYKAQYPRSKTLFGFEVLQITLSADSFTARFCQDIPSFAKGTILQGGHTKSQNHFLTCVTA
jgi:4'-phosphopantetheinyl transferase EntD